MMLVSEEYGFLFIHVPKTGGTSLVRALKGISDRPNIILRNIGYFFDDRGIKLPRSTYKILGYPYHVTARTLIEMWGRHTFDKYFSFALVRNPWDLTISEYFYIKRKRVHAHHKRVRRMSGFKEYLRWKAKNYARPQCSWLTDSSGEIVIDYIGRFEEYNESIRFILDRIGVDVIVPHANRTERGDYRQYYDDWCRAIVAEMYREDIDQFGYEF